MKAGELFEECIEMTGEWAMPEYTKILNAGMTDMAKHEFTLLWYKHGIGETKIKMTLEEINEESS